MKAGRQHTREASDTDKSLLLACREADPDAWERLMDRYERLVYSIPLSYGLSREDAADVAQITFTILVQSVHSLDDNSRLGSWLATVARRHTWRMLEGNRREAPVRGEDLAERTARLAKDESNPLERWETVEWLEDSLAGLGGRCKDLLFSLYFDPNEPSYDQISKRLGMPVGSIGPTRARCLGRLRNLLEGG